MDMFELPESVNSDMTYSIVENDTFYCRPHRIAVQYYSFRFIGEHKLLYLSKKQF